MLYSNKRKKILSGWLEENDVCSYKSSLKLQKFLFFYETFSKVSKDTYDFTHLKGYERGPVFSNVWGDYTKENVDFSKCIVEEYHENIGDVNIERALKADFLVRIMSEDELSELTHRLNIWRAKESKITNHIYQVALENRDFTKEDDSIILELYDLYDTKFINNSDVISINNKYFVLSKKDTKKLKIEQYNVLSQLSLSTELKNPVLVNLNGGALEID